MKTQRIAIGLTVINLALLIFLLAQNRYAGAQNVAPVLRGRGLEIVDAQGQTRAENSCFTWNASPDSPLEPLFHVEHPQRIHR